MSLSEKIAKVVNPSPDFIDPEDDVNTETSAKLDVSGEVTVPQKRSLLQNDFEEKYAGRKVSRSLLESIYHEDDTSLPQSAKSHEDSDSALDIDEEESNEDISDSDLTDYKKLLGKKSENSFENEGDEEKDENALESDDSESGESMVQQFSNFDVTSEIEKRKAVEAQEELWNRLCECRIKLQKLLIIANKLPQNDVSNTFKQIGGDNYCEAVTKGIVDVKSLLSKLLNLEMELVKRNPTAKVSEKHIPSDEEIPSSSDEDDNEEVMDTNKIVEGFVTPLKRKLKTEDYSQLLRKRHQSLLPYRQSIIQTWDEKTKISTGRFTQKSFAAFENSALKQMEQVLQDRERLLKRTRLKRTLYRVLGKEEIAETADQKQDILLRDYDSEIFDDDDFYRQLLKDVIQNKSFGMDPAILRKQLEIQKTRSKMKRKVDTRASKGRKIRYNIHPKLVNFMAPVRICLMSDAARDNLLKHIFGRTPVPNPD